MLANASIRERCAVPESPALPCRNYKEESWGKGRGRGGGERREGKQKINQRKGEVEEGKGRWAREGGKADPQLIH